MPSSQPTLHFADLDPKQAADRLAAEHTLDPEWLDEFAERLDQRRSGKALVRVLSVWGLSRAEAGRLFGVSRQALSKWLSDGAPPERLATIADLAAATDILVHYLKRDRIPRVVRRPIASEKGMSLVEMLRAGASASIPQACRDMFDFERAQSL